MAVSTFPFQVDESRLAPPIIRLASVKKADLITSLRASSAPVVTIIAPAGYGKTTLLGSWAEDDPRPFAWIALDRRHDDALVFLRDIAVAIHRCEPIAPSVFEALSSPGGTIWTRVPAVGNALSSLVRPIVIAIDDLHALSNPSSSSVLAALIDYVPPGSRVAVTSRVDEGLPIPRWRAHGVVQELGARDLRLDPKEADALLRGASVTLGPAEVAQLNEQTEGWPAGLYLAALSIRSGAPDLAHNVGFSAGDRYLTDYFRLEVLSRMPRSEAQFVMRTSVLGTLTGPLCDAVVGSPGSAAVLASLERSNRFVVPLDERGQAYRYHHLFRELLRIELERNEPEMVAELNRRAMAWYVAHDQPEAAVPFGQAAGDTRAVAELTDQIGLSLYADGRLETLVDLLAWFKDEDLIRFPAVAVYAGWVASLTGQGAAAERYVALAERSTSSIPLADGTPTIGPWVAALRANIMPNGVDQALLDADLALAGLAPESGWRVPATLLRGIAHLLLGSRDLARSDLHATIEIARQFAAPEEEFIAMAELALMEAHEGSWNRAADHARQARDHMERARMDSYVTASTAYAAVARVALREGRHAEARAAMTRTHQLRPLLDHGIPWLTAQVGNELTRAHLALGEIEAARAVLADTRAILEVRPNLGTLGEDARNLADRVAAARGDGDGWAISLTAAELRLLPYLTTHLTFPEIADRLFVTTNTIRTQAKSVYSKLAVTSRSEAIDRAVEVGLLEPMFLHRTRVAV